MIDTKMVSSGQYGNFYVHEDDFHFTIFIFTCTTGSE